MDFKRSTVAIIVGVYFLILVFIATLFITTKLGVDSQTDIKSVSIDLAGKNIVREAYNGDDHIVAFIDKGYYSVYNIDTHALTETYSNRGEAKSCLKLETSPQDKEVHDPSDLKQIAPNTYQATINQSTQLINSYILKGYMVKAYYSDNQTMDYYLSDGKETLRFIITNDIVVLFNVKDIKYRDIYTYISEGEND